VTLFGSKIAIPGPITTHGGALTINNSTTLNTGNSVSFTGNVDTEGGNLTVTDDNISLDTTARPVTLSTRKLLAGANPATAPSTGNAGTINFVGLNITLGSSSGSQGSASLFSQVEAGSAFTPGAINFFASQVAGGGTGNGFNFPILPKVDNTVTSIT